MHEDFATEPVPGLPAPLPPGEHIVWQGRPLWRNLARQAFHTRLVTAYFAIVASWQGFEIVSGGGAMKEVALSAAHLGLFWLLSMAILMLLAWLIGRTTVYTITTRRVLLRFGVALPKTIDVPFKVIETAALATAPDGSGNIPLKLTGERRIAYLMLWPHVRPWQLRNPQPMLRAVADAAEVAAVLTRSISESVREPDAIPGAVPPAAIADLDERALEASDVPGLSRHSAALATFTRTPLLAAWSLVLLSLLAVGLVRLSDIGAVRTTDGKPRQIYSLSFKDLGSDRIAVVDAAAGETIAIVEPGRDGLIRGALRGLGRARTRRGIGPEAPFQLILWDGGRLTLSDMSVDRHIPLSSFGPASTGALAALMALGQRITKAEH